MLDVVFEVLTCDILDPYNVFVALELCQWVKQDRYPAYQGRNEVVFAPVNEEEHHQQKQADAGEVGDLVKIFLCQSPASIKVEPGLEDDGHWQGKPQQITLIAPEKYGNAAKVLRFNVVVSVCFHSACRPSSTLSRFRTWKSERMGV